MTTKPVRARHPHKLALYQRAVQHPQAEASFLYRAYGHYQKGVRKDAQNGEPPALLREDFAGSCAVASAWVAMDQDHQAMAIESHGPTARWARRAADRELNHGDPNDRASDLHIVEADVLKVDGPKVDVTCALNFSTFIYHDRASLKHYFQHARRGLRRNGLLVIDAYGGPGAMRLGTQRRPIPTEVLPAGAAGAGLPGFTYYWEQRLFDPISHRIECRIHFELSNGQRIDSAFIYRWRLWSLPELIELMLEAGFSGAEAWCDRYDPKAGTSDGRYRPIRRMPAREDWVAYVVGVK